MVPKQIHCSQKKNVPFILNDDDWQSVFWTDGSYEILKSTYMTLCKNFARLSKNSIIRVTMGQVRDYFKPAGDMSMCDFLTGEPGVTNNYTYSQTFEGPYVTPNYYLEYPGQLGGAWNSVQYPDGRNYLSFWGIGVHAKGQYYPGGCCYYTSTYPQYGHTKSPDLVNWGLMFHIHLYTGSYVRSASRTSLRLPEFVDEIQLGGIIAQIRKDIAELQK